MVREIAREEGNGERERDKLRESERNKENYTWYVI